LREPDPDTVAIPPPVHGVRPSAPRRPRPERAALGDRRARLEDVGAGSDLILPVRRLAPHGLEAWAQVLEREYEGYVAKDEVRGTGVAAGGGWLEAADERSMKAF
jgi:hypothetical protein